MTHMPQGYIAGMTLGWTGVRGTWTGPMADRSMDLMVERLAPTWTAVAFAAYQATAQSTEISFRHAPTVTDDEVRAAIGHAKSLGLAVCLKPVVSCSDGTWRAHINFFDLDVPCEPTWAQWFASYTEFMLRLARIAEETGVEMLCLGCEMVQTDRREEQWRALVAEVRTVYSGLLTSSCDKYQEGQIGWWDAVDVMSSSGYCPIDDWDAQNAWYEAAFTATSNRQWVRGFMWWDRPARLHDEVDAATDRDYCLFGKRAEQTVRAHLTTRTDS
ncbi:MAG: glycoside hydrolase family 113 [Cellulomonas sp.]